MSRPLTEYIRSHRGGCYDDFIKECERVDAHALKLEIQVGELKRSLETIQLVINGANKIC